MNFSTEDIRKSLSIIEKLTGQNWLEEWVHSIRDQHGRQYHNGIPLLAAWWLRAEDQLASAQLTDSFTPSESTLRLTQLGDDLNVLRGVTGFNEQIHLLKEDNETFSHICYRLSIASDHVKNGSKLTLSNVLEKEDFVINHKNNIPVVVCAPAISSINELDTVISYAIDSTISRLPEDQGKIYIDLPLPSVYTAEHWLQLAEEIIKNNKTIPEVYQINLTSTFVEQKGQFMKLNRHYHKVGNN